MYSLVLVFGSSSMGLLDPNLGPNFIWANAVLSQTRTKNDSNCPNVGPIAVSSFHIWRSIFFSRELKSTHLECQVLRTFLSNERIPHTTDVCFHGRELSCTFTLPMGTKNLLYRGKISSFPPFSIRKMCFAPNNRLYKKPEQFSSLS